MEDLRMSKLQAKRVLMNTEPCKNNDFQSQLTPRWSTGYRHDSGRAQMAVVIRCSVCACVCERERERKGESVREREKKERERHCAFVSVGCAWGYVYMIWMCRCV